MPQGFLLSRHSFDQRGSTCIHYWLATPDGPVKLVIEGERPVFMVKVADRAQVTEALAGVPHDWQQLGFQTFGREEAAMLYFPTIDAHRLAQTLLQHRGIEIFEADFRLHDRYLMERFARGGLYFEGVARARDGYTEYRHVRLKGAEVQPDFTVVSLDVECSGQGELYSIGLYGDGVEEVLMVGKPEAADTTIHWVDDERALLEALEARIKSLDPDIIIGWAVVDFDFRLLLKRAGRHGLRLKLGRGGTEARWRDGREGGPGFVTLPGRVVLDGIDGLKSATYSFDSFSLEFVAQTLLGRGKDTEDVDNRLAAIEHDFRHNKPKLAAYNLEDCRLVWDIYQHTRLLDYLRLRAQLTGLELDRSGGSVAAFTNLYLPRLHRSRYVAPNLPADGGLASPGGYVMDSRPGLYDNVLVLDFKSLYPSIIRTFKIDPMGLVEGLAEGADEGTEEGAAGDNSIPGFRGARFSRDKHFLPDIITSLWAERDIAKQEQDAARSQAIKIIMNSFYGVLGSGGCRFYDTRLASSITLRGHEIMQQTARWIEELGHQVIYGDTDSTFVWLSGGPSLDEADAIGKKLASEINTRWQNKLKDELALECELELEFETHYQRFLMPTIRGSEAGSKKRYAGLVVKAGEEKLVFKGLETVRSDWTALAKQFQTQLYGMVFHGEDPSDYIRETVAKTRVGEMDEQLVYRKRLRRKLDQYVKNVPPQVRAARMADEHRRQKGLEPRYQNKGWIRYVITLNGPEPVDHRQSPMDYQHYIDRQLKPVADAILPFIELDFDSLVDGQLGLFGGAD
ncbi:DNA polymerase II [Microbulbifer hydrolyticus]|uniref:DNA polymerase n=1 Tax=Microbulbifer hydrolyticus TaxID=48074 RepID=A0A6P1TB52_9GAMM|nr:DNA polymerase II [Microbulbifer hydrolyticus]MBB5210514.1 DNA polymerase-2 [Microbulbifer hydrolyticus]QHQ39011.1 DNA polymerase II [Microbulbifer hydrolyticus]